MGDCYRVTFQASFDDVTPQEAERLARKHVADGFGYVCVEKRTVMGWKVVENTGLSPAPSPEVHESKQEENTNG